MKTRAAQGGNPEIVAPTGLEFQITDTKLYVPVVNLSKESGTKLLEQLKAGFKRTIKWNKYRLQMTIQPQNNTLNCLIDPQSQETDSLETWAELAVLHIYVENQAILEAILLCRASKCKQTKE